MYSTPMNSPIVSQDDPVLRKEAAPVADKEIGSAALQKTLDLMKTTLASQDDGIAIAAPQIGVSKQIFFVSGSVLSRVEAKPMADIIAINPVITKQSKDRKLMEEGCLSVRYMYGKVRRSTRITAEYTNEHGDRLTVTVKGLLAQVFQHEIDHLHGTLFIDKAKDVKEMTPEHPQR